MIRLPKVRDGQSAARRLLLWFIGIFGGGTPDLLRVVYYRPRFFGRPMMRATQKMLRGPSEWSIGERELFIGYISEKNRCRFCADAHCAVAVKLLGPEAVAQANADSATAAISDKARAMLHFLGRLALSPDRVTGADVDVLRRAGISESAITDGIYLCAGISAMNRIVDAMGCEPLNAKQRAVAGGMLLKYRYDF
jgi:uncharacterized peroxidase-related enzyme